MSPDEEEEGGAATAVAEDAPIPETPDEPVVPESEQEPAEQEEAESGAGTEDETGGLDEELVQRFQALKEADPDLFKQLTGGGDAPIPTDQERSLADREARLSAQERKLRRSGGVREAVGGAMRFEGQQLDQEIANVVYPHVEQAKEAIKKSADAGVAEGGLDYNTLFGDVKGLAQNISQAYTRASIEMAWDGGLSAFEDTEVYRHLSAEERNKVDAMGEKPLRDRIAGLVWVGVQAGLRAAPEEFKAKTRKQIEDDMGATEKKAALLEKLEQLPGGNGRKPKRGGQPSNTFEQLEHLYATDEATPEQDAEYHRQRQQRGLE